ncbi:MAG: hypothetical protein A2252_09210 [Elusimicrobia bacterium RIFOXYA2_FULL_39_19]|nr:MAG: hypothetical protein A2252_09210 [Elusimicrobia bacterium RIFOXYA2_FULL_39_19]
MRKTFMVVLCAMALMSGCANKQMIKPAAEPNETLIWSSHTGRPTWTVNEPEMINDYFVFVGLSSKYAVEKDARDDAQRESMTNATRYVSTYVNDRFQKIQTSYNLSSDIVDPTNVTRKFQEIISSAFVSKIKADEWYMEKWQRNDTKQTYYAVYLKAKVPKSEIDKSIKELADSSIADLKARKDKVNEEKAKTQYDNAMKAFQDLKTQGLDIK